MAKIYTAQETAITWKNTGGTYVFTGTSVANAAGRVGAQGDLGSGSRCDRYIWYAEVQCIATPTAGNVVNVYLARGNSTTEIEGNPGTSDAALSAETACRNMLFLGAIVVETATADKKFIASGVVEIAHRYVSPALFNNAGSALTSDAAEHYFTLTPVPPEIQ